MGTPHAWGNWAHAQAQTVGWSAESTVYELGFSEPVSVGSSTATFRTYVYEVWTLSGSYLGFHPTTPSGVQFAYSVLGEPLPLNAVISGPKFIPSGTTGTWTSISSGGDAPYSYVWTYQYPCSGGGGNELGGEAHPAGEQPGGGGTYKETGCLWYTGSTGSSFTKAFSGTTVTIKLRVTDAAGAVSTKTVVVTLTSNAQGGEQTTAAGMESTVVAATAESEAAAGEPMLTGVRPNPFNPVTVVQFSLPEASQARIAVYDMLGREVALLTDSRLDAGAHEVRFDASALPSGVYLVRMVAGAHVSTERITLLK